jgi:hypothetical protein
MTASASGLADCPAAMAVGGWYGAGVTTGGSLGGGLLGDPRVRTQEAPEGDPGGFLVA